MHLKQSRLDAWTLAWGLGWIWLEFTRILALAGVGLIRLLLTRILVAFDFIWLDFGWILIWIWVDTGWDFAL